jgi:acylphosphatase
MAAVQRRRVVVRGRVQGVFFRDATRDRARKEGVAGWVTNREDGAVEAVFEGDAEAVERMVRFVQDGPPRANVDDFDVTEEAPEGLEGFSVR